LQYNQRWLIQICEKCGICGRSRTNPRYSRQRG